MSEPNVVSDSSISAVDSFSMSRCQEFLVNRSKDLENSYSALTKQVVEKLPEAWSSAATERYVEMLKQAVEGVKLDGELLERMSDSLKQAIERHGTATKTAEAIADAIEMPTWPDEII